jgi:hypothetical protein
MEPGDRTGDDLSRIGHQFVRFDGAAAFFIVRSAMTLVTTPSRPPRLRPTCATAVDRPHVGVPKLLVFGLARNAIASASPELATPLSVSTATRRPDASSLYGISRKARSWSGLASQATPFV